MAITNFPTTDQLRIKLTPAQMIQVGTYTAPPQPPKVVYPEVQEMLEEKRKRVYALKILLETEETSLRVYERMLGE